MQNKHKLLAKFLSSIISLLIFVYSIPAVLAAELDSTPPVDVEGVEAEAGDQSVKLTWEASTDDTGVVGYRVNYGLDSVTEDGGEYMFTKDVDDSLEVVVDGLDNGVTYYFALTAIDAAGNESEFYSVEVSATPEETAADLSTDDDQDNTDLQDPADEENEDTTPVDDTESESNDMVDEENTDSISDTTSEDSVESEDETKQLADVVAPILANFAAKIENEKNVRLSWTIEEGLDNLSDQILYQSEDGGKNYATGKSLGKSVRDYLMANLVPGKTYTFKLTAKDMEGKEGEGVVTSITLPSTGAGLSALIALSFGIAGLVSKKKK